MEKNQISEEQVNKILLYTARSLPDRPGERGMRASEVKAYFYKFIPVLVEIINRVLSEVQDGVGDDIDAHDTDDNAHFDLREHISSLHDKDSELGDSVASQIEAHNFSNEAHSDIRALVDLCSSAASDELNWAMQVHDSSEYAHEYIRGIIENVRMLANDAYNLASGKSAVHPYSSVDAFITAVLDGMSFNVGDVVIFKETNVPDLTVFMKEQESKPNGDIELDADTELLEKQSYYLSGYTFVALESGIDTSKLVSTDEMHVIFNGFDSRIKTIQAYCEQLNTLIGKNSAKIDTKEDAHKRVSTTASSITLETFTEYDLGVRTSLSLSLPAETTGFEAIVNFACRAQASSFDAPEEIYFQGDDTLEGHLYPVSNRVYEINIKEVLGTLVAKVGACDYEVIE